MSSDEGFEPDEDESLLEKNYSNSKKGSKTCNIFCCLCNCAMSCCSAFWKKFSGWCGFRELAPRTVSIGRPTSEKFAPNTIKNQKYNIITFIPIVLFNQFKFFLNSYFLVMALSQFLPEVRIGYLYTYWGPLGFVLAVTLIREAIDDFRRSQRDKEINGQKYKKLMPNRQMQQIASSKIKVSDIILVEKNHRVPADMILLSTSQRSGSCFIRTDHLDGETDWKLRLAVPATQSMSHEELLQMDASVYAEEPKKSIHSFVGKFTQHKANGSADSPLEVENTLWANTVVASGNALGVVIYTGPETRSVMNNSQPRSKVGLLDLEINQLTKVLFGAVIGLSLVIMILKGFEGPWYRYMFRYVLLFSYIIPISLRVNLDMGKMYYSWNIQQDEEIPGTVVRSTTIPEELGRISYLLTDKTGTLTENEMIFKKLHLGHVCFGADSFDEVTAYLQTPTESSPHSRKTIINRVHDAVKALALCHNVTPVYECVPGINPDADVELEDIASLPHSYQASSPDEVALVSWTERVGISLVKRDLHKMYIKTALGERLSYTILQMFPFTSETKRMGIIVKEETTGQITFYMKGADVVMAPIVHYNDWLEEECGNMAREGLRTLVVAKKDLTEEQYQEFAERYRQAKVNVVERAAMVATVTESLARGMELVGLTGVEDKLQAGVRPTLELLRNAGIKVWMLTGDKLETAASIAKSSLLISRTQPVHIFEEVHSRLDAHLELNNVRRKSDCALIIKGDALEMCLKFYPKDFMDLACQCVAVVCCRCTPTQKADVVKLIQTYTKKRTCAIGDGGNDVSMIQMADAGIGIEGKEGKQASLAADFSVRQFSHIAKLLLVHGRYSYKRSAALSQFVIHRGLIITVMQVVFSCVFYYASVALFQGFLMVGYATLYTMFPVFFLVLDKDVDPQLALTFPELYKELAKGRSLSFKTFFIWVLVSIYQGSVIMYGALILFDDEFVHIVSISFTSLILTELLMVALNVGTWHPVMIISEFVSLTLYILSLLFLRSYFDLHFIKTFDFAWKVVVITAFSCMPLYILKYLHKKVSPPSYAKLS